MSLNKFFLWREDLVKTPMKVSSHFHNKPCDLVCRLTSFTKRLLWTNRVITALGKVLLVRLSTLMLIDMPTMKHQFGEFNIIGFKSI